MAPVNRSGRTAQNRRSHSTGLAGRNGWKAAPVLEFTESQWLNVRYRTESSRRIDHNSSVTPVRQTLANVRD
jgi:hypothetical protein